MSESIVLHLPLSEEYDTLFAQAREQTNLRKCRCWFDRSAAIGDIRVEVTDRDIGIRYETKKGTVEDRCVYSAVSALTELKRGIVVRLSHGRMLFLPAGGDRAYMLELMRATDRMEQHVAYRFQDCPMDLTGVSFWRRMVFRLRERRGMAFSLHRVTGSFRYFIIAIVCVGLLLGTLFVTQPIRNRRIEIGEAAQVHGELSDVKGIHGRHGLSSIRLTLADGSTQTVHECNSILLDELEELPSKTRLTLWVHPGSAGVLQIEARGELLLEFEQAMNAAWTESLLFAGLGVLMYVGCGYIWYDVFFPKKRKKAVGRIS